MGKNTGISLKDAVKVINKLGRQGYKENIADYDVVMSAGAAGQANFGNQTRLLTRAMLAGQKQNRLAIAALKAKAADVSGDVQRAENKAVSRYGSGMGQAVATAFGPAQATGEAAVQNLTGAARAAGQQSKTAGVVAGIAAQGVAAQAEAAKYAFSQALMARNMVTAETMANLTGQLYQTAFQYNAQWQLWKRQQEYAEKKADAAIKPYIHRLASEAPTIAADAGDLVRQALLEPGGTIQDMDIAGAVETWMTANNYTEDDPEVGVMVKTLQYMKSSYATGNPITAGAAIQRSIDTLYGGMPGYDKLERTLLDAVWTGTELEQATRGALDAWKADNAGSPPDDPGMHMPDELNAPQGLGYTNNPFTGQAAPLGKKWYIVSSNTAKLGPASGI
jgi:hypothetical protein